MTAAPPLLEIDDLTIALPVVGKTVVNAMTLAVHPGELVGIVGESGSGKTLAARAIMGFIPSAAKRVAGSIRFDGVETTALDEAALRRLRGARIGMIFQEPMTSLNPSMPLGQQLAEGLMLHRAFDAAQRRALILDMLRRVGLADPEGALTAYPHHFSGGMRQRIMLASVMLLKPALLIADEPTTALDAVVQREVLEVMVELTQANRTAVLMISHDLGMVARYCQRIVVMRRGDVVEQGRTEDILRNPAHPYTRSLLEALPVRRAARPPVAAAPVIDVRGLTVRYPGRRRLIGKSPDKSALAGIDLAIRPGEIVAVVGGSGSGKTTLGRCLAGLIPPTAGEMRYRGAAITPRMAAYRDYRLNCQMIFQDPHTSLNPRLTIGQLVGEPLRHVRPLAKADWTARVIETLADVGLDASFLHRYPHELSGGQRQRVAIARAVIRRPDFIIADEPVSALDVTVRGQILELFEELQRSLKFSCLFISHDLGVVEQIADRVIVMQNGRIVEEGDRDTVFDRPQHAYTRQLLGASPCLRRAGDGSIQLYWRSV